jgi:L-2-hydroxyglutarate oxidase LhgO
MREFARGQGIPLAENGKLIVAVEEKELPEIDRLLENARRNNVRAERLDEKRTREKEPHARALAAILVHETAVVDSARVIERLAEILKQEGVEFSFSTQVVKPDPERSEVETNKGPVAYGFLVNCAGAYADLLARAFGLAGDLVLIPFKGIYYRLKPERSELVRSNIYPVPDPEMPFLGVHFTRNPAGEVYIGPTAMPALGREHYGLLRGARPAEAAEILTVLARLFFRDPVFRRLVSEEIPNYWKPFFLARARRLLPELCGRDILRAGKVGIRPQLVHRRTGRLEMDYRLETAGSSLHVLNAVSPAFTGAFAFAEEIASRIGGSQS